MKILIIILVAALISWGGYSVYQKQQENEMLSHKWDVLKTPAYYIKPDNSFLNGPSKVKK